MCECEEPTEFVKVKFIGGEHLKGMARGPYGTYKTGGVYVMPKRYANKKAYPFWEYIGDACEDEIPLFWRKRMEEGMQKAELLFSNPTELTELSEEGEEQPAQSRGLTQIYGVATPEGIRPVMERDKMAEMSEQRLLAMEDDLLKAFITNNAGKEPDGRWGRERLLEEARKYL